MFAFRLCLSLGVPHPNYLPITAGEFQEWAQYWELEPWGQDWQRTALGAYVAAKIGGSKDATISDFMPTTQRKQTPAQATAILKAFTKAYSDLHDGRRNRINCSADHGDQ